jgi:tetratricopeptide (TPR) repeat protein
MAVLVGAIAAAAAAATVGATELMSSTPRSEPTQGLRPGRPPLLLDLGVRRDPEAVALRRASRLAATRPEAALATFRRYDSVEARIGAAILSWPDGTAAALERLARERPESGAVRLHLGLARYWSRQDAAALRAWRAAERVEPDSPAAIQAENLLHPRYFRDRPVFVPSFAPPARLANLAPDAQVAALEARARGGGVHDRLLYGVALQRLGRPVSAEREFAAAAASAPSDAEAQVAAAVGRFDKDDPSEAFSRLGPLAQRFPHASTVRFHLGLLLLWIGEGDQARRQLRLARAEGPSTPLGREANRFLRRLGPGRTS